MRKLKQISYDVERLEVLALDENGELWFGKMQSTDDDRRVVDWSPINGPKDGAGFTEPQMSFFDQWERDARKRIAADTSRETVPLATNERADSSGPVETIQTTPDINLEDGKGKHRNP